MRRRPKLDANHHEIVGALQKCGWLVLSLAGMGGGVPDLLVYRGGNLRLVEVKAGKGKVTPDQEKFHAVWPVYVVRTVEEALDLK